MGITTCKRPTPEEASSFNCSISLSISDFGRFGRFLGYCFSVRQGQPENSRFSKITGMLVTILNMRKNLNDIVVITKKLSGWRSTCGRQVHLGCQTDMSVSGGLLPSLGLPRHDDALGWVPQHLLPYHGRAQHAQSHKDLSFGGIYPPYTTCLFPSPTTKSTN